MFCSFIFCLYFSDWIFSIDLSSILLILYFSNSNTLLKSLSNLKFSAIIYSNFKFSIWFILIIFISLLNFSTWWDIGLKLSLCFVDMILYRYLSIFLKADLMPLYSKIIFWAFLGTVSIYICLFLVLSMDQVYFVIICMSHFA